MISFWSKYYNRNQKKQILLNNPTKKNINKQKKKKSKLKDNKQSRFPTCDLGRLKILVEERLLQMPLLNETQ